MKLQSSRRLFQLTALTFALAACEAHYTAEEHLRRAQEAEAKGDLQASLIELKNAAQKDPQNAQARLQLARHYIKAGQGADAEKEIKRARELGMDWEALKPLHADALLLQGEYQRVLDEVSVVIATGRAERARILRAQGDARLGLGQVEQGCTLYQEALKLDPEVVEVYWGLAKCALNDNKPAEARAQIKAAIRVDPNNAGSWLSLGDLERLSNNAEAAIQAYTTALKHDPKSLSARLARAQLYALTGKLKEAGEDLDQLRQQAPNYYGTHFLAGLLHYTGGKSDLALEAIQRALKANPRHAPSSLLQAYVLYERKSYENAAKRLGLFLQDFPGHLEARKLLAATYIHLNQPERALEVLQPYLASGQVDTQVLALAGEARLRQDDPAAASQYFAQAAGQAPASGALTARMGLALLSAGELSKGLQTLDRARRSQDDPTPDITLAYYYLAERQYDQALAILSALEKKLPDSPGTHNLKGMAYVGLNDLTRARLSFERALTLKPDLISATIRLAAIDIKENKLEQARGRYEGILKVDKANIPAMVGMAELAALQKREGEFVTWLERAVKANPAALVPRAFLANYHLAKAEPQKALVHAREAVNGNPQSPEALALLARIQLMSGDKANAVATATRRVGLMPSSADAHYQLAQAQAAVGDEKAVRASLQKALELDPNHIEARAALSRLEVRTGRATEAVRQAREIQNRASGSALGFALEGDAHWASRRPAEAAAAYLKALERGREGGLVIKAHRSLMRSGQTAKADELLVGWLKEQPRDHRARVYLAESYLQRGQRREAVQEYESLLSAQPDDVLALNNLALLYHQQGDRRALGLAERAHRLQPSNPLSADTLGWILIHLGQTERGLKLLEQAHAADTQHPEVRYHYAFALHRAGKTAQARQVLAPLEKAKLPAELQEAVRQLIRQLP